MDSASVGGFLMFLESILTAWVFFTLIYGLALLRDDYSVVDIFWGSSFVVLATVLNVLRLTRGESLAWTEYALWGFVALWGLRLTLYLGKRNWSKSEDYRYVAMREKWGPKLQKLKAYLKVYMTQGFFHLLIATGFILAFSFPSTGFSVLRAVFFASGALIFLIGWVFETLGDYQLQRFKADPQNKGKVLTHGVWAYTRHPNYFGEVAVWWGLWLVILSISPLIGLIGVLSPLIITWLLLYVSGIPLLEKRYAGNEAFEAYKKTTNAFFPWFKRAKK